MPNSNPTETRVLLAALAPTWLAVAWFVSKAQWFWNNRPDLQFGWIVLLLSAFVFWDRWEKKPAPRFRFNVLTALFAMGGAALLFVVQIYQAAYGFMAASMMIMTFGVLGLIAANVHFVFGSTGLRYFAFPFLFLLIALPMPSAIYNPVVSGLQSKVAILNVELLGLFGVPAQRVGSLIQLPNGTLGIDEACSGIRSLQSTIMATLFIGYLALHRFSLQAALFILGIGLAFIGNVARSLYLSLSANSNGVESIKSHDGAGWSVFIFTAAGVALLAWSLSRFEKWSAAQTQRTDSTELERAGEAALQKP